MENQEYSVKSAKLVLSKVLPESTDKYINEIFSTIGEGKRLGSSIENNNELEIINNIIKNSILKDNNENLTVTRIQLRLGDGTRLSIEFDPRKSLSEFYNFIREK